MGIRRERSESVERACRSADTSILRAESSEFKSGLRMIAGVRAWPAGREARARVEDRRASTSCVGTRRRDAMGALRPACERLGSARERALPALRQSCERSLSSEFTRRIALPGASACGLSSSLL
jgi:hypothetical protein